MAIGIQIVPTFNSYLTVREKERMRSSDWFSMVRGNAVSSYDLTLLLNSKQKFSSIDMAKLA